MNPTHAVMRLISSQPDKEQLAEALGLLSYWGKDSASATITGKGAKPAWREAGADHRPRPTRDTDRAPGDQWRHQRIQRALGGEKIA